MLYFNLFLKNIHPLRLFSLVMLMLFLSSCALLFNGTNQTIPVSTMPSGVDVYIDGEFIGVTPLEVELFRGKPHEVKLELGDQERIILLKPEVDSSGLVGLGLDVAPLVGTGLFTFSAYQGASNENWGELLVAMTSLGVGATTSIISLIVDTASGAIYTLSPAEVKEVF